MYGHLAVTGDETLSHAAVSGIQFGKTVGVGTHHQPRLLADNYGLVISRREDVDLDVDDRRRRAGHRSHLVGRGPARTVRLDDQPLEGRAGRPLDLVATGALVTQPLGDPAGVLVLELDHQVGLLVVVQIREGAPPLVGQGKRLGVVEVLHTGGPLRSPERVGEVADALAPGPVLALKQGRRRSGLPD